MRWLVLASTLACGFVVFVFVTAVTSGPPRSPDAFELHEPETDDEKAAARVAIEYVRRLLRRGEVYEDGSVGIEHISVRNDGTAVVWLKGVAPGPGHSVSLRRVDGEWRGVSHGSFALA